MENKRWSNRDWFWLVGILIMIIILLIAGFKNSDAIELNFSIISSAVSIALALVAIFIALKQDSDNQQVNNRLSYLLNEISASVRNVDAKVDRIDPKLLYSVKQEIVEEYSQESKERESFTKEEVDEIVNKVSDDLASNINIILNQTPQSTKSSSEVLLFTQLTNSKRKEVSDVIKYNKHLNIPDMQHLLQDSFGVFVREEFIREIQDEGKRFTSK